MRTAGHVKHGVSGVLAAGAGSVLVAGCVEVAVEKLKEGFAVKRSEEGGKYSSVEFPPLNPFGGFTVELEFGRPRGLCWWGFGVERAEVGGYVFNPHKSEGCDT